MRSALLFHSQPSLRPCGSRRPRHCSRIINERFSSVPFWPRPPAADLSYYVTHQAMQPADVLCQSATSTITDAVLAPPHLTPAKHHPIPGRVIYHVTLPNHISTYHLLATQQTPHSAPPRCALACHHPIAGPFLHAGLFMHLLAGLQLRPRIRRSY